MPSGVPEYQDETGGWRDEYGEQVRAPDDRDTTVDYGDSDGNVGSWDDGAGGTQYGAEGEVSAFSIDSTDGDGTDYELTAMGFEGGVRTGEHGFGVGAQANLVEFSATGGEWDADTTGDSRFKGGASVGVGFGVSYDEEMDADGDGYKEQSIGLDVGPLSLGYSWEEGGDNLGNTVEGYVDAAGEVLSDVGEGISEAWESVDLNPFDDE